jgi:hypothetical protein
LGIRVLFLLTDALKKALFSVWHINPKDFTNRNAKAEKGQAVVGCKVYIIHDKDFL